MDEQLEVASRGGSQSAHPQIVSTRRTFFAVCKTSHQEEEIHSSWAAQVRQKRFSGGALVCTHSLHTMPTSEDSMQVEGIASVNTPVRSISHYTCRGAARSLKGIST